jgi:HD-GYP domain-containing protein (c-di-GMP phosphodiesterase class II)
MKNTLKETPPARIKRDANELIKTIEKIYYIKDLDTMLERVLYEARQFVKADAGTIYLKAGDYLYFSFVQNDTFSINGKKSEKNFYTNASLKIDKHSLAGYVAQTGQSLLIDDVYHIRSDVSFSFNPEFDKKTSYKTSSILIVPLTDRNHDILGVLQLINAKDLNGKVVPFSMQDRLYISQFARNAANAIENAKLSRQMALRMVDIAELRDPFETSQHAKRVGSYSVEIYMNWAEKHNVSLREKRNYKDRLRIAAILHDVGKVAVSDTILKKHDKLTKEELKQVHMHTIYGARLFKYTDSPWDKMATEVTLNHHERWDGTGYPGKLNNIYAGNVDFGPGKKEKQIPLSARIVALADVYDSLLSERAYKKEWSMDRVLKYIRDQSGTQFDPELVPIFLLIQDTIQSIRQKYSY